MPLPPPRFRLRSIMMISSIVALTIWAVGASRRWSHCRWRAECDARAALQLRADIRVTLALADREPRNRWILTHDAARRIPVVAWHEGQAAKFERAMWRPWNLIPREYPEPELADIPLEPRGRSAPEAL